MLLEVQWEKCYTKWIYIQLCLCAFVWLPEKINAFSEIQVFKCFLCACAANDAGRKATSGPPQELGTKRLVI